MSDRLTAPFPWFGGKSRAADLIWKRLGDVPNYVEPFAGSLAVLLGRPTAPKIETVNDLDCFIANAWRAIQSDPDQVAHYADQPVNEADLVARHIWLVHRRDELALRVQGDPEYCDAKVAGWWIWGICCWIGRGWCSGAGPWGAIDGKLVHLGNAGRGVNRQLVHLGNAGRGVNRQLVHLGDAGQGVNRQRFHLGNTGRGVREWMDALADRLRRVRVCCGDWNRVCGDSPTVNLGVTGVVLDPPYADTANRDANLYREESLSVAHRVREWALEHGDDPMMRIALCGYEGEHDMPGDWSEVAWTAKGGYASQGSYGGVNKVRERVWFSPHCLEAEPRQRSLF